MPDRILLPLIVACALFMENLDSTVLATALPAIARDFGESPIHLKLALTSYLLAIAVFFIIAVAGAVIMALVAFFYLMARYALAPRTDPRPAGARRVMKTARVAASAITAFIIPVALAAMVMISLGI